MVPTDERTRAWQVAASVLDPELPVVTIEDLGILRDVTEDDQGRVHVQITPTYSGCPAMETIRTDLVDALTGAGYQHVAVEFVLSPAWTTDWLTEEARAKLTAYGVRPPGQPTGPGAGARTLSGLGSPGPSHDPASSRRRDRGRPTARSR